MRGQTIVPLRKCSRSLRRFLSAAQDGAQTCDLLYRRHAAVFTECECESLSVEEGESRAGAWRSSFAQRAFPSQARRTSASVSIIRRIPSGTRHNTYVHISWTEIFDREPFARFPD